MPPAASFLPVRPRTDLVDQVLDQLRGRILNREFAPGSELPPEGTLGEMLGVSRTVVREAMRTLRAQGLVEVAQGRKPRVKPASPQFAVDTIAALLQRSDGTMLDLLEVRRPLEGAIAGLAADRASDAQIEQMADAIARQAAAAEFEVQIDADLEFHALLATASGNPVFQMFLGTIAQLLRKSLAQTIHETGTARAVAGHQLVLEAVRRRDAAAAQREMLRHLELAEEDLRVGGNRE